MWLARQVTGSLVAGCILLEGVVLRVVMNDFQRFVVKLQIWDNKELK